MNFLRLTALAALLALSLAACRDEGPQEAVQRPDAGGNPLLQHVPENSPYLAANLEPLPNEVIEFFLDGMGPALQTAQANLAFFQAQMEEGADSDEEMRFALALMRELDGKLDHEGLKSLGLDLGSPKVVYGMGSFPVFRIGLLSAEALRAAIDRVLTDAGIEAPEQEFQGVGYWRLAEETGQDIPAGLYLSILDDHLAMSVFPLSAEAELLPAFLGLQKPAKSNAAARLLELNRAHQYTAYGSGILDLELLADEFMRADSITARSLAGLGDFDPASLSQVCRDEIRGMLGKVPRMKAGTTELSTEAVAYEYRLEMPPGLAAELLALVPPIPMAGAFSDRLVEIAFGMRFGRVRDLLREKVTAVVAAPYRCERLQDLNEGAVEALAALDRPLPPLVNNFNGIRLSLDDIDMSAGGLPAQARGHVAVHVEKPQLFLGMAQMFLPDLAAMEFKPGEPPLRLPERLVPLPGLVVHAALTSDTIGMALGAGEEEGLLPYLNQEPVKDGTFMSANYDMDAYLDYSQKPGKDYGAESEHAGHPALNETAEAFRSAFRNITDRSYSALKFTPDGFVAESRTSFQAPQNQ